MNPNLHGAAAIALGLAAGCIHPALGAGDADLDVLTKNVYCEAGNQSFEGKLAVAFVTLQRVADKQRRWPRTVHRVVYEPGQFSWTELGCQAASGPEARRMWIASRQAAEIALAGDQDANPVPGACFFARNEVRTDWMVGREVIAVIGEHTFYAC